MALVVSEEDHGDLKTGFQLAEVAVGAAHTAAVFAGVCPGWPGEHRGRMLWDHAFTHPVSVVFLRSK